MEGTQPYAFWGKQPLFLLGVVWFQDIRYEKSTEGIQIQELLHCIGTTGLIFYPMPDSPVKSGNIAARGIFIY